MGQAGSCCCLKWLGRIYTGPQTGPALWCCSGESSALNTTADGARAACSQASQSLEGFRLSILYCLPLNFLAPFATDEMANVSLPIAIGGLLYLHVQSMLLSAFSCGFLSADSEPEPVCICSFLVISRILNFSFLLCF